MPARRPRQVAARWFRAVLAGEHTIVGFRNADLAARLYPQRQVPEAEGPAMRYAKYM